MRVPSVRGALRWWGRLIGADVDSIFGTAADKKSRSSSLIVRDISPLIQQGTGNAKTIAGNSSDYFLWPLQTNPRGYIPAGSRVNLSLLVRSGRAPVDATLIKVFLLLGALGTRSRRCYGSVWPEKVVFDGGEWDFPKTTAQFTKLLRELIPGDSRCLVVQVDEPQQDFKTAIQCCVKFLKAFRCGSEKSGTPSKWGGNDHDATFRNIGKEVYRPALGLPLTQSYSNGKHFESSIDGFERMASPLLFKVVPLREGFVPIFTAVRQTLDLLAEDVTVHIQHKDGPERKDLPLNFELLDTILKPECTAHREIWKKSKILAEFFDE